MLDTIYQLSYLVFCTFLMIQSMLTSHFSTNNFPNQNVSDSHNKFRILCLNLQCVWWLFDCLVADSSVKLSFLSTLIAIVRLFDFWLSFTNTEIFLLLIGDVKIKNDDSNQTYIDRSYGIPSYVNGSYNFYWPVGPVSWLIKTSWSECFKWAERKFYW